MAADNSEARFSGSYQGDSGRVETHQPTKSPQWDELTRTAQRIEDARSAVKAAATRSEGLGLPRELRRVVLADLRAIERKLTDALCEARAESQAARARAFLGVP